MNANCFLVNRYHGAMGQIIGNILPYFFENARQIFTFQSFHTQTNDRR